VKRSVKFVAWPVAVFVLAATGIIVESGGAGELAPFLAPSLNIDSDHPAVRHKAKELVKECRTEMERARALYEYVRDSYNLQDCKGYVASEVLECGGNSCRQRSILLAALARAVNIPARLQLQRVVIKAWKTDDGTIRDITFAHGITALYLEQRWVLYEPVGNRVASVDAG
jgi:transglutaminase-like putative cysteine protease